MFIGYIAVGFAAKRAAPQASLGVLVGAVMRLDFIWPILVLAGVEQVQVDPGKTAVTLLAFTEYSISHSLASTLAWAVAAAGAYWAVARYRASTIAVALAVVSYWFLYALVHRPDLPLHRGSATLAGLGLWNSMAGTALVEGGLFVAGVWLYAAGTRRRDRVGTIGLWAFVVAVSLIYVGDLTGSPPPSARTVAVVGVVGLLFPVWAAWFDERRAGLNGRGLSRR